LSPVPEVQSFVIGSLTLGFFSTWLGMFLWNKGSSSLPVSFAGQLTIFETIFGLLFVFLIDNRLPSWIEFGGATLMLSGVIVSINIFKKKHEQPAETSLTNNLG
jgi:drug/metabolite transporter (DMT)-like permease